MIKNLEPVYKILTMPEWEAFQKAKVFKGSEHDLRDGFIHLSSQSQIQGVLNRYFKNIRPVVLLKISKKELLQTFIWEPSSNGDLYPHSYSPINVQDVHLEKLYAD